MIQRVQSLYLLLAAAVSGGSLYFPYGIDQEGVSHYAKDELLLLGLFLVILTMIV